MKVKHLKLSANKVGSFGDWKENLFLSLLEASGSCCIFLEFFGLQIQSHDLCLFVATGHSSLCLDLVFLHSVSGSLSLFLYRYESD